VDLVPLEGVDALGVGGGAFVERNVGRLCAGVVEARRDADRWFRARRVEPRIESEVSGNEAILSLVALGCGVIPRLVLDKSPLSGEVRVLDVRPPLPPFRVGFCVMRKRLDSPVIGAFWDSIADGSA
jgi:LysR family positive regulator for ilvC